MYSGKTVHWLTSLRSELSPTRLSRLQHHRSTSRRRTGYRVGCIRWRLIFSTSQAGHTINHTSTVHSSLVHIGDLASIWPYLDHTDTVSVSVWPPSNHFKITSLTPGRWYFYHDFVYRRFLEPIRHARLPPCRSYGEGWGFGIVCQPRVVGGPVFARVRGSLGWRQGPTIRLPEQ